MMVVSSAKKHHLLSHYNCQWGMWAECPPFLPTIEGSPKPCRLEGLQESWGPALKLAKSH
jgi:hypothetical protein